MKQLQAKHLPDDQVLATLRHLETDSRWGTKRRWVSRWEIEDEFPTVPPKVVLAKLRSLIKRGVIDGCTCGCRGDLYTRDEEGIALYG